MFTEVPQCVIFSTWTILVVGDFLNSYIFLYVGIFKYIFIIHILNSLNRDIFKFLLAEQDGTTGSMS